MKILVVDDSLSTLQMISYCASAQGLEVIPCERGLDAVRLFEEKQPDMILLDVVLPDIDGYEVAARIREIQGNNAWTPLTFLTAMTRDEDLAHGLAVGGDDYLFKPVSAVVLEAKIRAMQRLVSLHQDLRLRTLQLDIANRELKRLSSLDGLTGIGNRRLFDELLAREWRRALRNHTDIGLLMCDVDFFKLFNDSYGHQAGDVCLKRVAETLASALDRGGDMACRYGGEEFAIILSETGLMGAYFVGERIREAISHHKILHEYSPFGQISLSIGVASLRPQSGQSAETLIKAADDALYAAKGNGRNRVCRMSQANHVALPNAEIHT